MEVKKLKQYTSPALPTRDTVDQRPELLKLVPKRWQTNPAVLTALAAGCILPSISQAADRAPLMGRIAPPRMVLPEEEARKIILEEARKSGLTFSLDQRAISILAPAKPGRKGEDRVQKVRMKLDGTDRKRNISFEYVAKADIDEWQAKYPGWSVTGCQPGADSVRKLLVKADKKQRFGVFYDPQSYSEERNRDELRKQVQDFIKWLKAEGVI